MSEEKPTTSETQKQPTPTPAVSAPKQAKPSAAKATKESSKNGAGVVVSLVIIAALAAGGYFGHQLWQQQTDYAQDIKTLNERIEQQARAMSEMQRSERALSQELKDAIAQVDGKLSQQQTQVESFVSQLSAIKGSTRKDWLLAEAEYLLRIANQRLVIEKDPMTSEALLQAADAVLAEINDPSLMPVRIKIAEELLLLRGLSRGQIDSLLMRLNAVSNQLSTLRLDSRARSKNSETAATQSSSDTAPAQNENWWQRILAKLNAAFSRAISIQRHEEPLQLPPSPEYSAYLKQNLALRIEQAKLLLMRHRFDDFTAELSGSVEWAKNSFPTQHPSIDAIIKELAEISALPPQAQEIEISGSLELLRARIESKYRDHTLELRTPAEDTIKEGASE